MLKHYYTNTLSLLQRKIWLRDVLADVCKGQMDEVTQIKRCLAVLRREGKSVKEGEDEEDEDERETAFAIVSELCENLDNARGL